MITSNMPSLNVDLTEYEIEDYLKHMVYIMY